MNPFLSLLTYRAFRPDPLDVEEPLGSRFRKRLFSSNKILAVSIGLHAWRTCPVTFDEAGLPSFGEIETSPPVGPSATDALSLFLRSTKAKHKTSYAAVGLAYGFDVLLSNSIPRLGDVETMHQLQQDPTKFMGEGFTIDDGGAVVHHPTIDTTTLRFKVKASELKPIREILAGAGLSVARIVCEQAQMVELAYSLFPGSTPNAQGYQLLLFASPSSSLILPLWSDWSGLMFDGRLDQMAVVTLASSLEELLAAHPGGADVKMGYIDGGLEGMENLIAQKSHLHPTPLLKSDGGVASFRAIVLN